MGTAGGLQASGKATPHFCLVEKALFVRLWIDWLAGKRHIEPCVVRQYDLGLHSQPGVRCDRQCGLHARLRPPCEPLGALDFEDAFEANDQAKAPSLLRRPFAASFMPPRSSLQAPRHT